MTDLVKKTKEGLSLTESGDVDYDALLKATLGTPLKEVTDVAVLQEICVRLWSLWDDIDTLDDMCKGNDECYRKKTRARHEQRFNVLLSDGYNLFLPKIDEGGKINPHKG